MSGRDELVEGDLEAGLVPVAFGQCPASDEELSEMLYGEGATSAWSGGGVQRRVVQWVFTSGH